MQAQGSFYGTDVTYISFSVLMESGNVFCEVAVVYGYEEAAVIWIPEGAQAVIRSEHQQIFRLTIEEVAAQHPRVCKKGEFKVLW